MTEVKNTKGEFINALILFRSILVQPKKDGVNPHYKSKYATLDSVVAAIDDAAEKANLTYVQMTDYRDGAFVLITTIMHTSGESISGSYVLPSTGKPQEIGSALTYARRYALSAAFGVVADEDDDGNSAAPVIKQPTQAETEAFKNYKAAIKACASLDELKALWVTASKNIARLPAEYVAELNDVKEETKQSLGA
jgi:hypothetical protein